MTTEDRVRALNDRAVEDLIEAHRRRSDEPLVLAVRYGEHDPETIRILEVLEGFPGSDEDDLLASDFEASARLRIFGKLRLVLGSPAQVKAAALRCDPEISQVGRGAVLYRDGSAEAADVERSLGL